VRNTRIAIQVERTRARYTLGSTINRTVRAKRTHTEVSANALLVSTALLVGEIVGRSRNHLALRSAIHRVGQARLATQVKRTRASRALSETLRRTVDALSANTTVRTSTLLIRTTLLVRGVTGRRRNHLAQSVAVHRVTQTIEPAQIERAKTSRALRIAVSRTVLASGTRTIPTYTLLVSTALLVGQVASNRANNLALRVAIHRVRNASTAAQVKSARASRALRSAVNGTIRSQRSRASIRASALFISTALLIGHVAGSLRDDLALGIAVHRVRNAHIVTQIERTRTRNALGIAINRTIRASRGNTTMSANTLLLGTTLLVRPNIGNAINHLAQRIAIHRVGFARTVA
jgi:hypothetical protein